MHLKRNETVNGQLQKKNDLIDFPLEGLDLNKIDGLVDHEGEELLYDCYAICNHHGSLTSGHYWARCRNLYENKWYELNDSGVNELTPDGEVSVHELVVDENCQTLLFKRRDCLLCSNAR